MQNIYIKSLYLKLKQLFVYPIIIMFNFDKQKRRISLLSIYTSESKKYFFEIKLVSRDDMSAKSAETIIL